MSVPRSLLVLAAVLISLALVITGWGGRQASEGGSGVAVPPGQADSETDEPARVRPRPEPPAPLSVQGESRLPVPPHLRFAGIVDVPVAESWEALLEHWSEEDRSVIEGFTSSLDRGAYFFKGEEEFAWLVTQGFPMPAEILAASAMGELELKQLAVGGNTKAAFFYMQRVLDKPVTPSDWDERDVDELVKIHDVALASGSPFLGYVEAERRARVYPNEPWARASGLAWAAVRGDSRAAWGMNRHEVDPTGMLLTIMAMQSGEQMLRYRARGLILTSPVPVNIYPAGSTSEELYHLKDGR